MANWVSQLEHDKLRYLPDQGTMRQLAEALRCTPEELLRAAGYLSENIEPVDSTDPDQEFWSAYGDLLTDDEWETLEQIASQFMRSRGIKP